MNCRLNQNKFDILHASFLMIHLYTHADALREFYRVLKPGGKLIITDVNDDSFEGPRILKRMISKHAQVYEGNRKILNILPLIAKPIGFNLISEDKVTVRNDGDENKVELDDEEAHIDKYMMWAMFSFIEQDEYMKEIYNTAAEYYLKYFPKISIGIYTQIYEKPG
jgi:SAM-dependent methyltransferase